MSTHQWSFLSKNTLPLEVQIDCHHTSIMQSLIKNMVIPIFFQHFYHTSTTRFRWHSISSSLTFHWQSIGAVIFFRCIILWHDMLIVMYIIVLTHHISTFKAYINDNKIPILISYTTQKNTENRHKKRHGIIHTLKFFLLIQCLFHNI